MEPQTEMTNSPGQNQTEPPKDSVRSIMTSPRYWLAALLPLLGVVSRNWFKINIYLSCITPSALVAAISFSVNYMLPFATIKRRAFYSALPTLIVSIILIVLFAIETRGVDYLILIIPYVGGILLILNVLLVLFGWLGAKAGIARGHKA